MMVQERSGLVEKDVELRGQPPLILVWLRLNRVNRSFILHICNFKLEDIKGVLPKFAMQYRNKCSIVIFSFNNINVP